MTDGSLDLGGFTLTTEGDHIFTAGTISNGTLTSTSAGTSTYTNTTFSADAIVDVKANGAGYSRTQVDPSFQSISSCEYWVLDRTNGTSNVNVTLSFRPTFGDCSGVTDPSTLLVARWDGSTWTNEGNSASSGTTTGTVTSNSVTSFSPFTLASTDHIANPLPIELVNFTAKVNQELVNIEVV